MAGEHERPWRTNGDREIDRLERRVRSLEEWRLGAVALVDTIPRVLSKLEQQERTDAIERGVAEGLRKAETRGWGKTERRLAMLGGVGIIVSLALNLAQTVQIFGR